MILIPMLGVEFKKLPCGIVQLHKVTDSHVSRLFVITERLVWAIHQLYAVLLVMAMIPSRELANKKLLEELELNKKLMKQGGVAPLNSQNSLQTSSNSANKKPTTNLPSDTPVLSASQRIALNAALTQSNGFFIPQDSAFGNLILPVLPRFDEK